MKEVDLPRAVYWVESRNNTVAGGMVKSREFGGGNPCYKWQTGAISGTIFWDAEVAAWGKEWGTGRSVVTANASLDLTPTDITINIDYKGSQERSVTVLIIVSMAPEAAEKHERKTNFLSKAIGRVALPLYTYRSWPMVVTWLAMPADGFWLLGCGWEKKETSLGDN